MERKVEEEIIQHGILSVATQNECTMGNNGKKLRILKMCFEKLKGNEKEMRKKMCNLLIKQRNTWLIWKCVFLL